VPNRPGGRPTSRWPQRLLELQRAVLNFLMSDGLAARVLDSGAKVDRPDQAFQLSELYQRLADDLWGELAKPGPGGALTIAPARRELQRDYVNRLAMAALRPSPSARVDSRGLLRVQARAVLARLEAAQARNPGAQVTGAVNFRNNKPSPAAGDTSAHLADCIETLRQALSATLQRQGL
jgi:hypothetical protein